MVEESPRKKMVGKNAGSNGIVEREVQEVEERIRVLFLGLEERLGRKLGTMERILSFMHEYVAYLINRVKHGHDGKVPHERSKGKNPTVLGIGFGEEIGCTGLSPGQNRRYLILDGSMGLLVRFAEEVMK